MKSSPSEETLEKSLGYTLSLEYLGIHIEDATSDDLLGTTSIKLTVPESSELDPKDDLVLETIGDMPCKTSDDLINIAKYVIRDKISTSGLGEDDPLDDDEKEELAKYIEDNVKIYAKVRKGDVWNLEKANEALTKIDKQIKEAQEYTEV